MNLQNIEVMNVVDTVQIFSKKGEKKIMKNRPHFGLSFANSGRITYIKNSKAFVSDKYTAVILPKGGNYTICREEQGEFTVINFECDLPLDQNIIVLKMMNYDRIVELNDILRQSFINGNRLSVLSAFYQILSLLVEQDTNDPLFTAKEFINSNISNPNLTNNKISEFLSISEGYLDRQFIKYTSLTPKQYIIKCRIEKAKRLLVERRYPISVIGEKCGYTSAYSFSRAFKMYVGCSPSSYRQSSQMRYF